MFEDMTLHTEKFMECENCHRLTRINKEQFYVPITVNPIPTGHGLNQPIYSYHVTQAGRNRVKIVMGLLHTYLVFIQILTIFLIKFKFF